MSSDVVACVLLVVTGKVKRCISYIDDVLFITFKQKGKDKFKVHVRYGDRKAEVDVDNIKGVVSGYEAIVFSNDFDEKETNIRILPQTYICVRSYDLPKGKRAIAVIAGKDKDAPQLFEMFL